jgi:magnesium transporter
MINYYYKSLRTGKLQELKDYKRGAWIHAEAPTHEEIEHLAKKHDLDLGHLKDALDEDEMPRLEREGERSYIFVRYAYKQKDGDFGTVPLLFVFGKEILLTVTTKHLPSLDAFLEGRVDFTTTQRAKLVLRILQQIGEHYDSYISGTTRQIKAIRTRLRGHDINNQDFIAFVTIEDELNEFLSSLQPTNATLRRLLLGKYLPMFDQDQDIVEDILLNNEQSIEACNSNMKSISNIREAYSAISSNNLNRTIKILTAATLVLTIPTMFFSMYGMNVPLPLQHKIWMLPLIVVVTILIVLVIIYAARRKRIL